MTKTQGSAAAPNGAPQSAASSRRDALRTVLPPHLAQLRRTLALAEGALTGPDPEASFGYLRLLRRHLRRALTLQQ